MFSNIVWFFTYMICVICGYIKYLPVLRSWYSKSPVRRFVIVMAILILSVLVCLTIPPEFNYSAALIDYIKLTEPIVYAIKFIRTGDLDV